ncbi:MAG: hypothetical protein ABL914_13660, partial [Novosphingobium sp.]|uniref:hypothetical protein n=1 Tax=Novosphingobium sp. TaxID=1874826 RepID=UPI0032B9B741
APHRPAGFVGQIGHWLNARAEALWQRLGGVSADQKSANAKELRRLRAENAKLRDQLEAFLALQQAAIPAVQTSAQGRALLPLA